MLDCDAIALLEGWQESIGARCEVAVGVTLNFSFIDATTLCPVVTPSHVPICGGYSVRADRYGQVWLDVAREIARARRKFPSWPNDPLHAVAVVGEEFGELTRAALQLCYEPNKVTRGDVRAEAVQLAAMAMRFLASFDRYDFGPGVQHGQAQP